MVVLVALLQSSQDGDGRKLVGLIHHHRLEASLQGLVLLEVLLVFVERRGTDGTQFAAGQRRLQDVGGIHGTLATAGTYQRVNLVDEEDDLAFGLRHFLHDALQSFLKLAFILRTGQQRTHVEREELLVLQVLRHVTAHDALGQTFHDGGLTRARFTDEDRVVLRTARQNLQHASYLVVTAYHWVELAFAGIVDEVLGIFRERLEVLVAAHRLHLLPLSQFSNGLLQTFLGDAGILHDAAGGAVHREQCQQHRLHAHELVAHLLGRVLSALQHLPSCIGEVGLAALHAWQMRNLALHEAFHLLAVHTQLTEQIVRDVLSFLHDAVEQVNGLHSLLTCRLRTPCSRLHGLLRLNRKLV